MLPPNPEIGLKRKFNLRLVHSSPLKRNNIIFSNQRMMNSILGHFSSYVDDITIGY